MITPEQIQTAIAVLNASVAGQLDHIDPALLAELEDAIDLASYGPIECEIEEAMHACPNCGMACDCDGEDTWLDNNAVDCIHECDEDENESWIFDDEVTW